MSLTITEILYFIIPLVIASTVPLALVALGALYSERSGVVNIALEGIMLMGAYVGAVAIKRLEVVGVSPGLNIFVSLVFGLFIGYILYILIQMVLALFKISLDFTEPKIKYLFYGVSAVIGVVVMYLVMTRSEMNIQVAMVGLLVGAVVGTLFSFFHAFAAVNMKANQIISATALNMFAPAFAIFVNRTFSAQGTQKVTIQESYRVQEVGALADIPSFGEIVVNFFTTWWTIVLFVIVVGSTIAYANSSRGKSKEIFKKITNFIKKPIVIIAGVYLVLATLFFALDASIGFAESSLPYYVNSVLNLKIGDLLFKGAYLSTLLGIVVFATLVIVLYKTKFGLRLRSCGENPQAADSLGINIYKIRYSGVLVSGALAGMGGVIFVLSFASNFNATVSGFGFLALAVLIFGNWKPGRIIMAALFFAFMRVIANTYSVIPFLNNLDLNSEIYSMLPYLATLIVLAFVSKNSASPRAAGEPYDPGKR